MWLTQICVTAGTVFQSQIWYSIYCDRWNEALMGCPSLSVSLNIKRESPAKALWGQWLTYIEKHTHRCIFIRHIMFVCVNNPVISNCRIISTCVGITHKHTHSYSQKAPLMKCGDTMPLCQHSCVCSSPLLQDQPPSLLASDDSLLVFFSLVCCKSADDGLARVWTRGSLPVRQSHISLLPQLPALGLPTAQLFSSVQFYFIHHS